MIVINEDEFEWARCPVTGIDVRLGCRCSHCRPDIHVPSTAANPVWPCDGTAAMANVAASTTTTAIPMPGIPGGWWIAPGRGAQ